MLHVLKKKVKLHTTHVDPGAEFQDYKLRLEVVKKNIIMANKRIEESHKYWLQGMLDQREFCTAFLDGYPTSEDETYVAVKAFAEDATQRYDLFVRETTDEHAAFRKLQKEMHEYAKEIDAVEAHYPALVQARSEFERYRAKVDAMDKSTKVDDVKKARNRQKRDAERARVEELTTSVIDMQKRTYAKSVTLHQVALVAFWNASETHLRLFKEALEKTNRYTSDLLPQLEKVNVVRWYGGPETHPRMPERSSSQVIPLEPSLAEWGSKPSKTRSSVLP